VPGQVQGKNGQEPKEKKSTVVSSKKKWTVMNPIWRQMKKCTPSSEQNGQLVHWWLLVHSAPLLQEATDKKQTSHISYEHWCP
jgi:hypothetical protein